MFHTVSGWFRGIEPEDKTETNVTDETKDEKRVDEVAEESKPSENLETASSDKSADEKPTEKDHQIDINEVSEKALSAAKEWGSYLFNVGKAATQTVTNTAKQLKHTVEEKTILGEFSKENDKFVQEKREKLKHSEAAVPPWVGYNEEETMKSQILALSEDKRNFLRNPPTGVQFHFDYESSFPVAMAMLQEDPNLTKMRFTLVPKEVKEENFWRNYFYRVSLIKQSTQLTSLAQQTGSTGEVASESSRSSSDESAPKDESSSSDFDKLSDVQDAKEPSGKPIPGEPHGEDDLVPESPPHDHEFISDTFQTDGLSEEDVRKEMAQMGMNEEKKVEDDTDNIAEWERELQQELNEYEVVDDGTQDLDDADLENEILQQIEAEAKQS